MAYWEIIGKSVLGEHGFCQVYEKMGCRYYEQLAKIREYFSPEFDLVMTSMTGSQEVKLTGGEYFPKIRKYDPTLADMFSPEKIYRNCQKGMDPFRPGADFIIWDENDDIAVATFSREAPILFFDSYDNQKHALGTILRPSLMKYGDYLFSKIKEALVTVDTCELITCNHYEYPEGSIPSIVEKLASKYLIPLKVITNSESSSECYHRGEEGNHVVLVRPSIK